MAWYDRDPDGVSILQMTDLETFKRLPASILRPWLIHERDEAYKYLVEATDTVAIHRAQGKIQLVQRMLKLLDTAQTI
jgi:hypothetical protein